MTVPSRRTKARMDQLRRQLLGALEAEHPRSVRDLFRRMADPGLPEPVAWSLGGYTTVHRLLARMRREGAVPRDWITLPPAGGRAVWAGEPVEDGLEDVGR